MSMGIFSLGEIVAGCLVVIAFGLLAILIIRMWPLPPKLDDLHRKVDELPGGVNDNKPVLDAVEGVRQQLSCAQDVSESRWRHATEAINWIKQRLERFFR